MELTSIEVAKNAMLNADSSGVQTVKQFKKFTDCMRYFVPSLKAGMSDENAAFKIAIKDGGWRCSDRVIFDEQFKAILDAKFEYDGYRSGMGTCEYYYNRKESKDDRL